MTPDPIHGGRYLVLIPIIVVIVAAALVVFRYWRDWITPHGELYESLSWLLGFLG